MEQADDNNGTPPPSPVPPTVSLSLLVNHFKTHFYSSDPTWQLPSGPAGGQSPSLASFDQ